MPSGPREAGLHADGLLLTRPRPEDEPAGNTGTRRGFAAPVVGGLLGALLAVLSLGVLFVGAVVLGEGERFEVDSELRALAAETALGTALGGWLGALARGWSSRRTVLLTIAASVASPFIGLIALSSSVALTADAGRELDLAAVVVRLAFLTLFVAPATAAYGAVAGTLLAFVVRRTQRVAPTPP